MADPRDVAAPLLVTAPDERVDRCRPALESKPVPTVAVERRSVGIAVLLDGTVASVRVAPFCSTRLRNPPEADVALRLDAPPVPAPSRSRRLPTTRLSSGEMLVRVLEEPSDHGAAVLDREDDPIVVRDHGSVREASLDAPELEGASVVRGESTRLPLCVEAVERADMDVRALDLLGRMIEPELVDLGVDARAEVDGNAGNVRDVLARLPALSVMERPERDGTRVVPERLVVDGRVRRVGVRPVREMLELLDGLEMDGRDTDGRDTDGRDTDGREKDRDVLGREMDGRDTERELLGREMLGLEYDRDALGRETDREALGRETDGLENDRDPPERETDGRDTERPALERPRSCASASGSPSTPRDRTAAAAANSLPLPSADRCGMMRLVMASFLSRPVGVTPSLNGS